VVHGKKKKRAAYERRGFYVYSLSKGVPRKYFIIDSVFETIYNFHLK